MERRAVVFAVRPPLAEALVDGSKGFEFRRVRPMLSPGDVAYVYSTAPVQAIIGSFICGDLFYGRPETLWRKLGSAANTPRPVFRDYFQGSQMASAIEVTKPCAWATPLSLVLIRRRIPDFRPPQSYKFLASTEPLARLIKRFSSNGASQSKSR